MTNNIKELRQARGMTLEELGAKTGAHLATIQKLESGKMVLTLPWMNKIANALDITVGELLTNRIQEPQKRSLWRKPKALPVYTYGNGLPAGNPALYSHFDFTIPNLVDSAATSESFSNLEAINGLANINFLLQSKDISLVHERFYLIADQDDVHYLAMFMNDPARFVHPGIGSDFKDRILGQDRLEIIAHVVCGMLLLGGRKLVEYSFDSVSQEASEAAPE